MEEVSPEAQRAQRMAELADIAEFKRRHYREVIDASTPAAREARAARMREEERQSRAMVASQAEDYARWYDGHKHRVIIRELPKPKLTLWQRLLRRLKGSRG